MDKASETQTCTPVGLACPVATPIASPVCLLAMGLTTPAASAFCLSACPLTCLSACPLVCLSAASALADLIAICCGGFGCLSGTGTGVKRKHGSRKRSPTKEALASNTSGRRLWSSSSMVLSIGSNVTPWEQITLLRLWLLSHACLDLDCKRAGGFGAGGAGGGGVRRQPSGGCNCNDACRLEPGLDLLLTAADCA